ncbi:MAG: acetylxylan esterase [Actinomycetota bacterium]|nr:acetylxylan esterase [Actinomycetota bacterium]
MSVPPYRPPVARRRRPRTAPPALIALFSLVAGLFMLLAPPASAASLTEVTGFGPNPSKLRMYVYVPETVTAEPAIVVAVHYCHGDGPAFYSGSEFARLADKYGYVVIYPSVTQASDQCFDVASPQTLKHDGGSDSLGIVSMVKYALTKYHADPERVYATGVSSGAMMTNVLLGAYPDVFAAGAAFAGVPFGCFAGSTSWNTECAEGRISKTPQEWGDLVRAAHPGYTGSRPPIQLWHGSQDTTLNYKNFDEAIKQWTNVHGLSRTPTATDHPQPTWTRTRYADPSGEVEVEAVSMQGVPHNLPVVADEAIHFFGLDADGPAKPTSTPTVGPGGCLASYRTSSNWSSGFVGSVTVVAGSAPISRWTVALALPSGTKVVNSWGGQFTGSTGSVMVTSHSYNGALGAGASTTFGFQADGSSNDITATCTAD